LTDLNKGDNIRYPLSFHWFSKLNLTRFIPWHFDSELNLDPNRSINQRFRKECKNREVITFGHRQDQDTFAGFEIINQTIQEKVLVFHPSFGENVDGWNIVEAEYSNFFEFLKKEVLPTMEEWIEEDDVEDYLD